MLDLLSAFLGGGVAGVGAAGILTKMLLDTRLERSQRKFQHDLDQEKQERRAQLEVLSATQRIRPISFEQKSIEALEKAYAAVVQTSLPRHGFRRMPTKTDFSGSVEEQETGKYFHLFTENFQAFKAAFNSITEALHQVEGCAIYLAPDLERRIGATLRNIHAFYHRRYEMLKVEHKKAQENFDGQVIPSKFRSLDFEDFHSEMILEWAKQADAIREELKAMVREHLKAAPS